MDVVVPPGAAIKIQMYASGSAQVIAPTTLGGGTYSGSQLTMTASGTPTWDIPPGRALRCYCVSTTGGTFHLSPLRLASAPVGTPYWWGPATLGGTASLPSPDPTDPRGAWVLPATAGLTLIGTKAWTGAKTFTVPFYRVGAGTINAKITATTGTATLVTADGATVNGDGSLTIPADTHLFPSWTATDGATLTLTKGAGTGYAFYGPLYLDETVVPPTPPPSITKLIPTAGPDTGGTTRRYHRHRPDRRYRRGLRRHRRHRADRRPIRQPRHGHHPGTHRRPLPPSRSPPPQAPATPRRSCSLRPEPPR
jgi:hypothetical protein